MCRISVIVITVKKVLIRLLLEGLLAHLIYSVLRPNLSVVFMVLYASLLYDDPDHPIIGPHLRLQLWAHPCMLKSNLSILRLGVHIVRRVV